MTTHANVWGTRDTMHTHAWADGGGSYATVIELDAHGIPWRVTLIGDAVDTYTDGRRLNVSADVVAAFTAEYAMTGDYAGAYAVDASEIIGEMTMPGASEDDYVMVSHGIMYAVRMFGAPEDN